MAINWKYINDGNEEGWDEGIEQHFDKGGGDYECANCDWATNDQDKALRHKELYNHRFWMSLQKATETHKNIESD